MTSDDTPNIADLFESTTPNISLTSAIPCEQVDSKEDILSAGVQPLARPPSLSPVTIPTYTVVGMKISASQEPAEPPSFVELKPRALPYLLPAAPKPPAGKRTVDIALGRMDNGGKKIIYDRTALQNLSKPALPMAGFEAKRVRLAGHSSLVTVQVPQSADDTSRDKPENSAVQQQAGTSKSASNSDGDEDVEVMATSVQTLMYGNNKLLGVIDERYEPTSRLWQHLLEMLTLPDVYGKQVVRFARDAQRTSPYEIVVLDPDMMAHLWGVRRGCSRMTYEKLSRSLRYYDPRDVLHKSPRRLHWCLGSRVITLLNDPKNKGRTHWVGAELPDKWKYAYLGDLRKEHDKKNADRKLKRNWKDVDPNEVPADVEVTPFYVAVDVQHHECAKVFLKHSKLRKINLGRSSTTDVPLIAAIHNGDVSFVRVLVAHSPPIDVNECTTEMDDCIEGVTPMMHAIRTKQPEMATVLLEAGDRLKVNAADDEGKTALHLAVVGEGMGDVVEKLLKAGADAMAMDKKEKTPIDVAEKEEIKKILNEFKQDAKMEE